MTVEVPANYLSFGLSSRRPIHQKVTSIPHNADCHALKGLSVRILKVKCKKKNDAKALNN